MDIKTTDRITICGMTGVGKTNLAASLMQSMSTRRNPVVILDPLNQYKPLTNSNPLDRAITRHVPPPNKEALQFESICNEAMKRGNRTIFGEEAEMYIPQKGKTLDGTLRTVLRGRNRGVGVVAVTRRIAMLDKNFFSLSNHVFVFKHFSPNDMKYLADFMGKDTAQQIMNLKPFHFAHFQNGVTTFMEPVDLVPGF